MKIIVDIDNTLSLADERFKLAKKPNGKTNWNIAHDPELVKKDKPNISMIEISNNFKARPRGLVATL